jgi:DNA polymerase III epsilon subunit family exonuclease
MFLVALGFFIWNRIRNVSKASTNLSRLPSTFVVVDIETTGLEPQIDEIIEIAAVQIIPEASNHPSLTALITPSMPIPKRITQITGITQAMINEDGEPLAAVIKDFIDFFADHRLVFFNAPFDLAFLQKAFQRHGHVITNPVSDALPMARKAFPGQKNYKLTTLAKAAGLDTSKAHRALADCHMTAVVYSAAAQQLNRIA